VVRRPGGVLISATFPQHSTAHSAHIGASPTIPSSFSLLSIICHVFKKSKLEINFVILMRQRIAR